MSIQELMHLNAFDGSVSSVGNIDIFARTLSASSITLDKPYLNRPITSIYQWNFNLDISPSPSQTVNGIFTIFGIGQGVLNMPSQAQLDTYFGSSTNNFVFFVEVFNSTANALTIVNNDALILNIASGTPLNPSYNKYYFTKNNGTGPYVCINNN